jgi:hypothetical protein
MPAVVIPANVDLSRAVRANVALYCTPPIKLPGAGIALLSECTVQVTAPMLNLGFAVVIVPVVFGIAAFTGAVRVTAAAVIGQIVVAGYVTVTSIVLPGVPLIATVPLVPLMFAAVAPVNV